MREAEIRRFLENPDRPYAPHMNGKSVRLPVPSDEGKVEYIPVGVDMRRMETLLRNSNLVHHTDSEDEMNHDIDAKNALAQGVGIMIELLSEREQTLLRCYYYENMTLEQCGAAISRSADRARQLIHRACFKLRHTANCNGFVEEGFGV